MSLRASGDKLKADWEQRYLAHHYERNGYDRKCDLDLSLDLQRCTYVFKQIYSVHVGHTVVWASPRSIESFEETFIGHWTDWRGPRGLYYGTEGRSIHKTCQTARQNLRSTRAHCIGNWLQRCINQIEEVSCISLQLLHLCKNTALIVADVKDVHERSDADLLDCCGDPPFGLSAGLGARQQDTPTYIVVSIYSFECNGWASS